MPEGLVKAEEVREFAQTAAHVGLHSASTPGILALDLCQADDRLVLTGGNDKTAVVFNRDTETVLAVLKGHTKKVSAVIYHPSETGVAISASPDASVRVWSNVCSPEPACTVLKAHDAAVNGISLHATGDFLLSVSADEKWAFSDIRTGRVLCKVVDAASPQGMTCGRFHPDGLIFGVGTADAMVKIWDLKEQSNVANFPGHAGPVRAISFSEVSLYVSPSLFSLYICETCRTATTWPLPQRTARSSSGISASSKTSRLSLWTTSTRLTAFLPHPSQHDPD